MRLAGETSHTFFPPVQLTLSAALTGTNELAAFALITVYHSAIGEHIVFAALASCNRALDILLRGGIKNRSHFYI